MFRITEQGNGLCRQKRERSRWLTHRERGKRVLARSSDSLVRLIVVTFLKFWKKNCACSSSIGNKVWNSPHFSLSSKIGFTQSLLSSSNNNTFNKGFSNNNSCSSILMHSTRSPTKSWRELGHTACAVWPHARHSVVDRWVRRVRQCKKSAKNGWSVTTTVCCLPSCTSGWVRVPEALKQWAAIKERQFHQGSKLRWIFVSGRINLRLYTCTTRHHRQTFRHGVKYYCGYTFRSPVIKSRPGDYRHN